MDNTSFPKMLDPKKKILPDSQLLRWKDWFSRYKFTVRHLKGHHNILADFLSRPQKTSSPPNTLSISPLYIFTISDPLPPNTMFHSVKLTKFPPNSHLTSTSPECDFISYATSHLFYWLHLLLQTTNISPRPGFFDLDKPYATIPFIQGPIPKELLWYIWSMSVLYKGCIAIAPLPVYHYLCDAKNEDSHLHSLLEGYAPLMFWRGSLYNVIERHHLWNEPKINQKRFSAIFFLDRTYHFSWEQGLYFKSYVTPWSELLDWTNPYPAHLQELADHLTESNKGIKTCDQQCRIFGPIPLTGYCYEEFYAPTPHHVCEHYAESSQQPGHPFSCDREEHDQPKESENPEGPNMGEPHPDDPI